MKAHNRPRRPGKVTRVREALGLLLMVLLGFFTFGATAQVLNLSWGLWFGELFVFFGVPFVALQLRRAPPVALGGLTFRAAVFGFVAGAVNYLAWAVPLMSLAEHLFPKSVVDLFDGSEIFKGQSQTELAVIIAGVCLAAPLGEEVFFRGIFQPRLIASVGPVRGIFLTAFIFSFFHLDPVGFMARLELGVLFGVLAWRTGSIWPGVFAHAANNAVSSAAYFLTVGTPEADVEVPWYVPVAMLVAGNVALYGLWRGRGLLPVNDFSAEAPTEKSSARIIGPWLLAAVASVGVLLAFDYRGVALNLYDATHPASTSTRLLLETVRKRARAGEVELSEYFSARAAAK